MATRTLSSTDAFVVTDLDGAAVAAGPVRSAPKILVDGATWLARSLTYQFAAFERQASGASGGINARPEARAEAVAAFVAEVGPEVQSGSLVLEAAKGVGPADLAPLVEASPLAVPAAGRWADLTVSGVMAAAEVALGGLADRRVAVEGIDLAGGLAAPLVEAVGARGGRVVAVSTSRGTASRHDGFAPGDLSDAGGPAGGDGEGDAPPWAVFGADVDLLLVGSKAGALSHEGAAAVAATAVVPWGRLPVTAKALATLRRRGVTVVPDFVALAGPWLVTAIGGAPVVPEGPEAAEGVAEAVAGVLAEVGDHPDGPLLAACHRAEAFLRTWRSPLPFGRPLA